jgi:hypothetical protein
MAGRVLRHGVMWPEGSFGGGGEDGCRFVERMLEVVETLRLRRRPVLGCLYQAAVAHRAGLPALRLLPANSKARQLYYRVTPFCQDVAVQPMSGEGSNSFAGERAGSYKG